MPAVSTTLMATKTHRPKAEAHARVPVHAVFGLEKKRYANVMLAGLLPGPMRILASGMGPAKFSARSFVHCPVGTFIQAVIVMAEELRCRLETSSTTVWFAALPGVCVKLSPFPKRPAPKGGGLEEGVGEIGSPPAVTQVTPPSNGQKSLGVNR